MPTKYWNGTAWVVPRVKVWDGTQWAEVGSVGDAVAGDVLEGKTFSSSNGAGITGTMPNRGAVTVTPSMSEQTIPEGYHNGYGKVLAMSNVKRLATGSATTSALTNVNNVYGDGQQVYPLNVSVGLNFTPSLIMAYAGYRYAWYIGGMFANNANNLQVFSSGFSVSPSGFSLPCSLSGTYTWIAYE